MIKKIINNPRQVVPEALEGLVEASHGQLKKLDGVNVIVKEQMVPGKVGLVVGGGSGHEPVSAGFVGENLADGAACGHVFASPTPDTILKTIKATDTGAGVVNLVLNYAGDNLNFEIASEMAAAENIKTRSVQIWDDVASAPIEKIDDRRGIAGYVFAIKIVGGVCSETSDLDEIERIAIKTRDNIRSMGVAVSAGSIPESGEPTFVLGDDEIEIGMGIHGEPGVLRKKLLPADALVEEMMEKILSDLPFKRNDRVCLLVNNLGGTTLMEILIINRKVRQILKEKEIEVYDTLAGTYCTSLEMAGFSISLMRLDDELEKYYNLPVQSVALTRR
ncbi:MAG: dihydroxyacetone kinase subunit DhaK [Desulfobacula sp.]|uniref:dihydroxyacetone kinase subunit DhaK n=1 Tax=Desulfobacula sp. TaxID=2593537 RepID=UPI0025C2BDB1|nr:dihydroxyacetone kinase subunit DhaK [Desulfobacula sp.]MCD4719698.1 dihydroxyacetone kinase subunit DhaK [Desulfobacula sp.]